ncbi:hypothetical protein [Acaryochloris marina]|uniref:hypothetical protein n=1 Tax=Acaryochloris marina TaxID=155978 RepID=UPI0021C2666E|nr:hypothetical protein [Acaryochloris marina]BDM83608.1 hypothetical protein AM10699_64690 [Acaryochloris marina MBIC10699]
MKKIAKADVFIQWLAALPLIKQMVYQTEAHPWRVLLLYCPGLLLITVGISHIGSWAFTVGNGTLSGICASLAVFILIATALTAGVVWWKAYR